MDPRLPAPPLGRIRRNPAPRAPYAGSQRMRQRWRNKRHCQQHHYKLLSGYIHSYAHRHRRCAQSFQHHNLHTYRELKRIPWRIHPPSRLPPSIFASASQQNAETYVYTSASLPRFRHLWFVPGVAQRALQLQREAANALLKKRSRPYSQLKADNPCRATCLFRDTSVCSLCGVNRQGAPKIPVHHRAAGVV